MKKVVIVGSSIAGATAAYLLADYFDVRVYEAKSRGKIGDKLCGNLCTGLFLKVLERIGIQGRKFIKAEYNKAVFHSASNEVALGTKEFEIDRAKLIEYLIKQAEKKGARFNFSSKLEDVSIGRRYRLIFRRNKTNIIEQPDYVIGADGAMSPVANHYLLSKGRKFFLALQAEVREGDINLLKLRKKQYHVFVGEKFGHYAYIFPSKNKIKVGLLESCHTDGKKKFREFIKLLGITKRINIRGALIPYPHVFSGKGKVMLIGDAGGYQKFSGGGIVLAMLSAEAITGEMVKNSFLYKTALRMIVFQNKTAVWFFRRFKDKQWGELLTVLKDKRYKGLLENRDILNLKDFFKLLSPRMLWLWMKSLFRF